MSRQKMVTTCTRVVAVEMEEWIDGRALFVMGLGGEGEGEEGSG